MNKSKIEHPRLLLFTPALGGNSLGRTYCIWLLAKHLGWPVKVVSFKGGDVWAPLRGTPFESDILKLRASNSSERFRELLAIAGDYDVALAIKPLPESFGVARRVQRELLLPLVLDVDDPDLEAYFTWVPFWKVAARFLLHPARSASYFWMKLHSKKYPTIVSNPVLHSLYGGTIIPHVRHISVLPESGPSNERRPIRVVFVGTPLAHKGINVLREAVATISDRGYRLTVTAPPPADAMSNEDWIGQTSIEEGIRIVETADIVALPSLMTPTAKGQLPAKLVDGMMAGRSVVVTDVGPMRWAVGERGYVVAPNDVDALADALLELRDPALRSNLGAEMRDRAVQEFSVELVAPAFSAAIKQVIGMRSA